MIALLVLLLLDDRVANDLTLNPLQRASLAPGLQLVVVVGPHKDGGPRVFGDLAQPGLHLPLITRLALVGSRRYLLYLNQNWNVRLVKRSYTHINCYSFSARCAIHLAPGHSNIEVPSNGSSSCEPTPFSRRDTHEGDRK